MERELACGCRMRLSKGTLRAHLMDSQPAVEGGVASCGVGWGCQLWCLGWGVEGRNVNRRGSVSVSAPEEGKKKVILRQAQQQARPVWWRAPGARPQAAIWPSPPLQVSSRCAGPQRVSDLISLLTAHCSLRSHRR